MQSSLVKILIHDDVIKWKLFPRCWPFVRGIRRSPVNSPYKGQWRGALMFSLICTRMNGWVNNCEAGDLRRYRAHYDVIVMLNTDPTIYFEEKYMPRSFRVMSVTTTMVLYTSHTAGDEFPDSKVHGAKMGPTWVLSAPDGPHVGPMNLAIRVIKRWYLALQVEGKVEILRKSVESHQKVRWGLQSQASNLGCGKSQLENQLTIKKHELREFIIPDVFYIPCKKQQYSFVQSLKCCITVMAR